MERAPRSALRPLTAFSVLDEPVILCPPWTSDVRTLRALRDRNAAWLADWEPSDPQADAPDSSSSPPEALTAQGRPRPGAAAWVLRSRLQARRGGALTWAVRYAGMLVGEVSLFDIARGATRSAKVGYWIDEECTGHGIASTAVALAGEHCFGDLGLHRLEAVIRTENAPSRRLVERLGFREEGTLRGNVHVAGAWRDHVLYAALADDYTAGMLAHWRACAARRYAGHS